MLKNKNYSISTVIFSAIGGFLMGILLFPERFASNASYDKASPEASRPQRYEARNVVPSRVRYATRRGSNELQYIEFPDESPKVMAAPSRGNEWNTGGLLADLQKSYSSNIGSLFSGGPKNAFGTDDDALFFGKAGGGKHQRYGFQKGGSSKLPEPVSWLSKFLPL